MYVHQLNTAILSPKMSISPSFIQIKGITDIIAKKGQLRIPNRKYVENFLCFLKKMIDFVWLVSNTFVYL